MKKLKHFKKHLILPLIFACFSALSFNCLSQTVVLGTVKDAESKEPLKFATVYINGTTIGTISNVDGKFGINPGYFPCKLVISHIGYNRKVLNLNGGGNIGTVYLTQKNEKVKEVTVQAKDNKATNLAQFRESFLGNDRWGKRAKIKNEEAISFYREYEKSEFQKDQGKEISTLIAVTEEPLQVDLPSLGYNLHTDVVEARSNKRTESRLGYYYFKPKEDLSRRQKRTVKKNRETVYYNSTLHFLRSLFQGNLKEQGYVIIDTEVVDSTGELIEVEIDLVKYLKPWGKGKMLCGLENHKYGIWYVHNSFGEPINLKTIRKKQSRGLRLSVIHFLSDSCKIRSNGTTPDHSIMFEGLMAHKKTGASLPSNYDPQKE